MVRKLLCFSAWSLLAIGSLAADFKITGFSNKGVLFATNTYSQGVVTVMRAPSLTGPWTPLKNAFSLGASAQMNVVLPLEETSFLQALAVDLAGNPSWLLSADDILDLGSLDLKLVSTFDPVSFFLMNQLSPATQDLLFSYGSVPDSDLVAALVLDLNQVLQGPSIYDADRFAGVALSSPTLSLLGQNPQGPVLVRLNRMLLDDAYPDEFVHKQDDGFTNLVTSYGLLSTLAGAGGTTVSPNNKWLPEFEGGPATNALLSRPHIAMADRAGNIYIADKEAHAIRKVTLDGNIHTVAGNNDQGFGDTNPVPATSVSLSNPNGLWVFPGGKFYILDRDNGLIRKVETNGVMTLVVDHGGPILEGRGLWVSSDESILYYSAGTQVMRWDTTNGLASFAQNFSQLGNLAVDPAGRLNVTDRGANRVYRLAPDGDATVFAGSGLSGGGGDGTLATQAALWQVRGIWFLPTGACFLATDNGSQVWYVDTAGYIHLFLNGDFFAHNGDGSWFYDPSTAKVSKIRQITMDFDGNLIITEHDAGYIRKVQFLRHQP